MPKKASSCATIAAPRRPGWTSWRKRNTQFPSTFSESHSTHLARKIHNSLSPHRIRPKLDDLAQLHERHLRRPTLDDRCDEEQRIESTSQEISKLIFSAHRHIQCIRSSLGHGRPMEQRLTSSVVTSLLNALQEVTTTFRNGQGAYLRSLKSREARSNVFFDAATDFTTIDLGGEEGAVGGVAAVSADRMSVAFSGGGANGAGDSLDDFIGPPSHNNGFAGSTDEQIDEFFQKPVSTHMTQQQLLLFEEDNTRMAEHREQEVTKVVKSIVDLNDIFKDISTMVHEQGTVLDRIDYNVEQTHTQVNEGLKQLRQAEVYHRKNRKMFCILVLASVTLVMLVTLIFTKL